MFNQIKITGSVQQRLNIGNQLLEKVFSKIEGIGCVHDEKFQTLCNATLPFKTVVKPVDKQGFSGYIEPLVFENGKYAGVELALPYSESIREIPLGGQNTNTTMHELSHGILLKVDPRIMANRTKLKKLVELVSQDSKKSKKILEKIGNLYSDVFYECEISRSESRRFEAEFLKGGKARQNAIQGRLKNIAKKTEKFLKEIPENDLKLVILKYVRNGLRSESYAWPHGINYEAQESLNLKVQHLITKDNSFDELINLEEMNPDAYNSKMEEYFEKAGLSSKEKEIEATLANLSEIKCMLTEKMDFLNKKISRLIKQERQIHKQQIDLTVQANVQKLNIEG